MMIPDNPILPEFFRVRQHFASHAIDDIETSVGEAFSRVDMEHTIQPGQSVAIAVGSRGVSNLREIISAVVAMVTRLGGRAMVVPAMGSHGGATAEGQKSVLAKYGVDESVGCPIVASMDTVLVGTNEQGVDIHFDKHASQADHVIVVNRIKPHTRLAGRIESGLVKMLMIGLGKHRGATLYHQVFPLYDHALDKLAPTVLPMILERMPITLGLGIVEDAFENTSIIEPVLPHSLLEKEPELLDIARARMPRLPFDHADLLIVDQIGKEISGMGMDTNVIGRKTNDRAAAPDEFPKIRQIYIRSLTEGTYGNACGVGAAEYCHRRVVEAMDPEVTKVNCITAAHVTAGAVPLTFDCDRDVLHAVVSQIGRERVPDLKWMWISDTLHLGEVACSRGFYETAVERDDLEVLGQPASLEFDGKGDLLSAC